MGLQIHAGKNPEWADADHTMINVEVIFADDEGTPLSEEYFPFSAVPDDVEEHGRAVWNACVKGSFGTITEYDAPVIPLEDAKAMKLAEINARCDEILESAVSSYPESEVLTFDQQVEEVKAYQASGNASDAPLLSALAQTRGITLDELCERVMAKRHAFSVLSGCVIGQRQALEDRLDECTTTAHVDAIVVDITVPEGVNE